MSQLTEAEQRLRNLELLAVRAVMDSPAGRSFLWRVIEKMAVAFNGTYTGEALHSAYAEGRRSVGLALIQELQKASPAAYLLMLQEEMDSRLKEAAIAEKALERAEAEEDDGD